MVVSFLFSAISEVAFSGFSFSAGSVAAGVCSSTPASVSLTGVIATRTSSFSVLQELVGFFLPCLGGCLTISVFWNAFSQSQVVGKYNFGLFSCSTEVLPLNVSL